VPMITSNANTCLSPRPIASSRDSPLGLYGDALVLYAETESLSRASPKSSTPTRSQNLGLYCLSVLAENPWLLDGTGHQT